MNTRLHNPERLKTPSGDRCPEASIFIRRIPKELKAQFRAYCARRNISMTEWFTLKMREAIRNEPK